MYQGSPLLNHEFDDHESRKGIANGLWNQRSPGERSLPDRAEKASAGALTTFDRMFSLIELNFA
jgi:hypothetical protein